MSLKSPNRFQPLQEDGKEDAFDSIKTAQDSTVDRAEEAHQDPTNVARASSGWADDISLTSSDDSQSAKPSTTERRVKRPKNHPKLSKKKIKSLKPNCENTLRT